MLEPMAVAAHAIRRTTISPADKVVVCGLGTIGMFITMLLAEMKISNIYVIGNKDFQKNKIIEMGIPAENYCDSRTEEVDAWIQTKTGSGADVYFECVGKNETISCSVDNTTPGGSIVLVGNPYSDISLDKKVYWKILRNQLRVTGTWNSSFNHEENDDWHYVLNRLSDNRINPEMFISHRFDMPHLDTGLKIMRDKSEDYIKVMMQL